MKIKLMNVILLLFLFAGISQRVAAQSSICNFAAGRYYVYERASTGSTRHSGSSNLNGLSFIFGKNWKQVSGGWITRFEASCTVVTPPPLTPEPQTSPIGFENDGKPPGGGGGAGTGGGSPCGVVYFNLSLASFDDAYTYVLTSPSGTQVTGNYTFGLLPESVELETYNFNPNQLVVLDSSEGGLIELLSNEELLEAGILEPFEYHTARFQELSAEDKVFISELPPEMLGRNDESGPFITQSDDLDQTDLLPLLNPIDPEVLPPSPDSEILGDPGLVCMPLGTEKIDEQFLNWDFVAGREWSFQLLNSQNEVVANIDFTITDAGIAGLLGSRSGVGEE